MWSDFDFSTDPEKWVFYSALLDVWQDEEEPVDIANDDSFLSAAEWNLFKQHLLSSEPARLPTDSSFDGAASFFVAKAVRVASILHYNKLCLDLIRSTSSVDIQRNDRKVRAARVDRRKALDRVFFLAASALNTQRSIDPTLRALWHSELCATSPEESTAGLVRAFSSYSSDTVQREFFVRVSIHNAARCFCHLRQYEETIARLEWLLDNDSWRNDSWPLLYSRVVLLPAIDTMGDALSHLNRRTEARWYWDKGKKLAKATGSTYFKDHFSIRICTSRELLPPSLTVADAPRLSNRRNESIKVAIERNWGSSPDVDPSHADIMAWESAFAARLSWHAGDYQELLGTISSSAEDLASLANRWVSWHERLSSGADDDSTRDHKGDILIRGLEYIRNRLRSTPPLSESSSWHEVTRLLGYPGNKTLGIEYQHLHRTVWEVIESLLSAMKEASDLRPMNSSLDSWRLQLLRLVSRSAASFSRSAPAVKLAKFSSKTDLGRCLINPDRQSGHAECPTGGCSIECLFGISERSTSPTLARADYYLSTMSRNLAAFGEYLEGATIERHKVGHTVKRRTPDYEFICVRRWNSFSPNLGSLASETIGGGYLLRVWRDTIGRYVGVAIDPGYNFLENLFNEGFTIADLDVVVVTHAHPDHTDNIPNLLTLLRESRKRATEPADQLPLIMSEGSFLRFCALLDAEQEFIPEVAILSWEGSPGTAASKSAVVLEELNKQISLRYSNDLGAENCITIGAIPAYHDDGTNHDSIGIKVNLPTDDAGNHLSLAVLSDSKYRSSLHQSLSNCDMIVLHLGAVLDDWQYQHADGIDASQVDRILHLHKLQHPDCTEAARTCARKALFRLLTKNHLYLTGTVRLLCDIARNASNNTPLVVLSEFGEELRCGLRADLARRMQLLMETRHPTIDHRGVIPADVGLRIDTRSGAVRCAICDQYKPWKNSNMSAISARAEDEGLSFVCADCLELRKMELHDLLVRRRMHARPLHKRAHSD